MPKYPKKSCYSMGEPEVSKSCQDQSPEASNAPALVLDPRPTVIVDAIPPGGTLTVLGATIQHVEGESQADARVRLAVALMESLASVSEKQYLAIRYAVPRWWTEAAVDRSELLRR